MALTPKVKKRNGEIVDFHPQKITIAIQKAFAAVTGDSHDQDARIITRTVISSLEEKFEGTALIPDVELIQDMVESAIARHGHFEVARSYIIYRYEHEKVRLEKKEEVAAKIEENALLVE